MQNGTLGRRITVEVRAYDDGVAFRYVVPWSNPLVDMRIDDEVHGISVRQGCRKLSAYSSRIFKPITKTSTAA